jgi:flagellar motor protein MotB
MAKTDWELALNDGVAPPRPSRWRLVTGVISIVALSAGIGFYLPLYRTEQLMAVEYQRSRALAAALEQRLAESEQSLAQVSAEHKTLSLAKLGVDAVNSHKKMELERLTSMLSQKLQSALDRQRIRFELLPSQLNVGLFDPALFTTSGDTLTLSGQQLLCTLSTELKRFGKARVTVRAFADTSPAVTPAQSRWSGAAQRAAAIAQVLSGRCGLPADSIEIATSLVGNPSPANRIELSPLDTAGP